VRETEFTPNFTGIKPEWCKWAALWGPKGQRNWQFRE